jgi:hypothetical protein
MIVTAIDPGTAQSAWLTFDGVRILNHEILTNEEILVNLRAGCEDLAFGSYGVLVIEQIESFGMPVGREVFQTVFACGRFAEAWFPNRTEQLPRKVVKQHLCQSLRATDANIRQALIDRFGPGQEKAVGRKASKGPLFGIAGHEWAAMAVAVTFFDQFGHESADVVRPGRMAEF